MSVMTEYDVSLGGGPRGGRGPEDGVIPGGDVMRGDDAATGENPVGAGDSVPDSVVDMPLWARLHLTHAVMQSIADEAGVDLLHIKGPAVAAELRTAPRRSSDVDVLVRPAHLPQFLAALDGHGWRLVTSFAEGSPFGHAANYGHDNWTYVDVHRNFPGPLLKPDKVFEILWQERILADIAHRSCALPNLAAQVVILALHEARGHQARGTFEAWELSGEVRREQAWTLARRLDAEVPMAAAVGRLREFRDRRDYALWRFWSEPESDAPGGDRLSEWKARLRSARGVRAYGSVLASMVRVNRTHLRMELGHEPSRGEIVAEYRHRASAGWSAVIVRLRAKARDRWVALRARRGGGDS